MLAHLKRLYHGTRGIPDQIIRQIAIAQHAIEHIVKNVQNNISAKELTAKLIQPVNSKTEFKLDNGIKLLPSFAQEDPELQYQIQNFPTDTTQVTIVCKILQDLMYDLLRILPKILYDHASFGQEIATIPMILQESYLRSYKILQDHAKPCV